MLDANPFQGSTLLIPAANFFVHHLWMALLWDFADDISAIRDRDRTSIPVA